jgi:hypothetical protein
MLRNKKTIAAVLAVLLLLGLCLLVSGQLHESRHHDDDCPFCALARTWRAEKCGFAVAVITAVGAVLCRLCRRFHYAVFRRRDTLAAQKVLMLS